MSDNMDEALDRFKRVWNRKDLEADAAEQIEQFKIALAAAEKSGRESAFDKSIMICEHAAEHYKGAVVSKITREIRVLRNQP